MDINKSLLYDTDFTTLISYKKYPYKKFKQFYTPLLISISNYMSNFEFEKWDIIKSNICTEISDDEIKCIQSTVDSITLSLYEKLGIDLQQSLFFWIEKTVFILSNRLGIDIYDIIPLLYDMGDILIGMNYYDDAYIFFTKGRKLSSELELNGISARLTAKGYGKISYLYFEKGELKDALYYNTKALMCFNGFKISLTVDPTPLSDLYNARGYIEYHLEHYNESAKYHIEASEINKDLFGASSKEYALSLREAGLALAELDKDYNEQNLSYQYLLLSCNILESTFEYNHEAVLAYNHFALYHFRFNRFEEANRCYTLALNIAEKTNFESSDTLYVRFHKSQCCYILELFKEALDLAIKSRLQYFEYNFEDQLMFNSIASIIYNSCIKLGIVSNENDFLLWAKQNLK